MMRIILTVWAVVQLTLCFAPAQAAPSTDRLVPTFEDRVAEIAATEDIVGLAMAVVRDGRIEVIRTYGVRERGGGAPVTPDTVFRLASLSKGFAGSLVAQLVTEGKLTLDAPAAPFAPEFRLKNTSQIGALTLEHVMSHRLGLPPNAYDNLLEADIAPSEILNRLGGVKPICGVGQCYAYQNVTFDIAARAVESADGRPYGEAMAIRLFQPLRMETASVGFEGLTRTDNWARTHRRRKGQPWRVVPVKPAYYRLPAAAGVNASITDMARWLIAQMGHAPDVLTPDMLTLMHTPRVKTPAEIRKFRRSLRIARAHYGLGWRIYEYKGETIVNHRGSVDGYSAAIAFLPARNAGIVTLTNSASRAFVEIMPQWLEREINRKPPS